MIGESLGERGRRGDDSGTEDSGKWAIYCTGAKLSAERVRKLQLRAANSNL